MLLLFALQWSHVNNFHATVEVSLSDCPRRSRLVLPPRLVVMLRDSQLQTFLGLRWSFTSLLWIIETQWRQTPPTVPMWEKWQTPHCLTVRVLHMWRGQALLMSNITLLCKLHTLKLVNYRKLIICRSVGVSLHTAWARVSQQSLISRIKREINLNWIRQTDN